MRIIVIIFALFCLFAGVMSIVGCSGPVEQRRLLFDDAIDQVEQTRDAAKLELERRIADVKTVFDRQAAQLEAHIADLEAQLAAKPEAAPTIEPKIEAAKAIGAKIDATYNATTGKLEDITAEIFRVADQKIAALKAEREAITSEDPGEQIKGVGRVIGATLPGQAGLIISLVATTVGGILSSVYQAQQKNKIKSAAIEAVGTMSVGLASGAVKMDYIGKHKLQAAQSSAAKAFVDEANREYGDVLKMVIGTED
jgi:hypothetical protein